MHTTHSHSGEKINPKGPLFPAEAKRSSSPVCSLQAFHQANTGMEA